MFKISPIEDKTTQKEYIENLGGTYREGYFAYAMVDNETGELMGLSQFEIEGECGYISDILEAPSRNDFEAMFILGRATMNFIDMCGAHKCRAAACAAEEKFLVSLGFKKTDSEYFCDMTGMFDGHCKGH
jgi:hypothetical protein